MELIGLIATLTVGLLGYLTTYLYNLRLAKRADRLKFLNAQMDELYGPMYIITQTGRTVYDALRLKAEQEGKLAADQDAPRSPEDVSEWRIWIEEVFQPLNEQLEQIIINKAHLVIDDEFPESIKLFLAHSAGYKAVIRKWELNNFSESTSIIPYPVDIAGYAEKSYQKLRKEQIKLIGHRKTGAEDEPAEDEQEQEIPIDQ